MSRKKISDNEILAAYRRTGNVWKAGAILGVCGQSVHERLVKMEVPRKHPKFTDGEADQVRELYEGGFETGDGQLKELAGKLGRTVSFICGKAGRMGLTSRNRKDDAAQVKKRAKNVKEHLSKNGHPRGMKGKHHTQSTRKQMSRSHKELWRQKSPREREEFSRRLSRVASRRIREGALGRGSWKHGWRTIGGRRHYFRSAWEANYARYLERLKVAGEIVSWSYETRTFHFNETENSPRSYTPDFFVTYPDGQSNFHEVKGWFDERSQLQQELMKRLYPEIEVIIRAAAWFRDHGKSLCCTVPGWEK